MRIIERFIKNDLTLKRWRRFKSHKRAVVSGWILIGMLTATFCAPIIANNKPLVLRYSGKTYFPAMISYHAKELGITDSMVVKYKKLELDEHDMAIWPLIKWDPYSSNDVVSSYPAPPSTSNILGIDESGRDVFARILYGFKYSFMYAFFVWAISFIIGIVAGGVMGYFGGRADFIGQRVVEIWSTVPAFFLLLILIAIFEPSLFWLVVISTIFGWIGISYYVRGEFLKLRKREFVEASRAIGANHFKIIFKHILPNSLGPVITFTPFFITSNIVGLASLDYLGFGLPVPTPSWGELLNQASKHFTTAWWLAVYPSLALALTLILINSLGEGVRDAMDPHMT